MSIQDTVVRSGEIFTTSNVMLDVLVQAGITHCCMPSSCALSAENTFSLTYITSTPVVNLGSDHPSLLEAFIKRAKDGAPSLKIVTSPNEMVALSAAQGYAQVCGKPAAVIVHVVSHSRRLVYPLRRN